MSHSGQSAGSGSVSNTSSAAAKVAVLQTDTRSSIPARLPRPVTDQHRALFSSHADVSTVSRPRSRACSEGVPMTMSARGNRRSNASSGMRFVEVCRQVYRNRCALHAHMPKTFNRRATFAPMSPMPSTSAVLPEIVSAWSYFCQICACLLLQYRPNERYSATRPPIAYSAMIVPNAPDAFAPRLRRFSTRTLVRRPPRSAAADAGAGLRQLSSLGSSRK